MKDFNKRTTLRALAATAAATGLPAVAGAAVGLTGSGASKASSEVASIATGPGISVVFGTRDSQAAQAVTLTNTGKQPITLKHIYPGLVTVGERVYDLNALFEQEERTLEPGHALHAQLDASDRSQIERRLPAGLSSSDTVRVTTPFATLGAVNSVSTTRRVLT